MASLLLVVIYSAFISLGLPDSLLGSAWPSMYGGFGVPVSYAGIISMIIAAGTIVSSVRNNRLTKKLGTGKLTALSVGTTALALFGFSISGSFWMLCLWAVPYGLGAGSVDASLNNYVALHYPSRHMSWLHCMWGAGAAIGPYIMGYALTGGKEWNSGYRYIAIIQTVLTAVLFASLPLWKIHAGAAAGTKNRSREKALSVKQILSVPGAKEILSAFFCYCALEQTAGLWGGSFLVFYKGISPEDAARFVGLFFLGIAAGRGAGGFLTLVMSDRKMTRLGLAVILAGICAVAVPAGHGLAKAGLVLIGLGCAPIFPCVIHSTPEHFGRENAEALIGLQMASAYVGILTMPPLFGLIAERVNISLFPAFLLILLAVMTFMHEKMIAKRKKHGGENL